MAFGEFFSVMIVTWNLGMQDVPHDLNLEPLLGLPRSQPDMYAIGLQEMGYSKQFWKEVFPGVLQKYGYVLLERETLENIGLFIFVKTNLRSSIISIEKHTTATGILNMIGNKGGAIICMEIFLTRTCFVNSHLNAHEENTERRLKDIEQIKKDRLNPEEAVVTFWFGDLNFRLENKKTLTFEKILNELEKHNEVEMFKFDELTRLKSDMKVFNMFTEGRVTFPPTFKFKMGTSDYNNKKKRRPAWTDRVLYKSKNGIVEQLSYQSHQDLTLSDHKPVTAEFKVNVVLSNYGQQN